MFAGIIAMLLMCGLIVLIIKYCVFIFFGIVFPLVTYFYVQARWEEGQCGIERRLKIRVIFPFFLSIPVVIIPTLLVLMFEDHPFVQLFGQGATGYTMFWFYLQGISLFYGGFAIIGIIDEIVGFLFERPISAPPDVLEAFRVVNRFLGRAFLIVGILSSVWGASEGLPGVMFSHEFFVRYFAILYGCLPGGIWDQNWTLVHHAIVCGPSFILIGIWMTLAGIETPCKAPKIICEPQVLEIWEPDYSLDGWD